MKRSIFILSAILLVLSGCTGQKKAYGELTKLAPYLYEINYSDMDESLFDAVEDIEAKSACSSVRNGSFHGRNLDLFYNEGCEVVVHMAAGKDRFASVGVCGGSPELTDEKLAEGDPVIFAKLPLQTLDGINENGVAVNVNVVPAVDHPVCDGTKPGARRIHIGTAPRYILNHAKSAAHALELLQGLDMHGGFGDDFTLHLMISDPKETYIVEFIDNEVRYYKGGREADGNIMTNLFSTDLPQITPHAEGVERYAIIKENYAEGNTEEGMAHLMQRVKYTQAYELTTDPFWYSENNGVFDMPDGSVLDVTINTPHDEVIASIQSSLEAYQRHERKGEFWQTVNTSVYNVDKCSLLLYVQENYDQPFRFTVK